MSTLRVSLHPAQQAIFNSKSRFKVVAAGRRFGKTVLGVITCILKALDTETPDGQPLGPDSEVVYIGVDREQAKRNAWNMLCDFTRPLGGIPHKQTSVVELPQTGCRIRLMGMDNPDAARGMKIRYALLDEYADMPDDVWAEIIRPALMDTKGGAMFIGTPKGKNHFYHLWLDADVKPLDKDGNSPFEDWEAFNFTSSDNTTLDRKELRSMATEYSRGSDHLYKQEIEASFISKGGKLFSADDFLISSEEPAHGSYYVTADLAGFSTAAGKRNSEIKKRDDSAIAINKITEDGDWWVKEIQSGQWTVRETAIRLLKAYHDNSAIAIGIEKGISKNAVEQYLETYTGSFNRWMNIQDLTHGNRHKWDRIQWALQGRCQRRQITLNPGDWNDKLIDQAVDFPDRRTHDDLLDALAYQDQIATPIWADYVTDPSITDGYEPLDEDSGF